MMRAPTSYAGPRRSENEREVTVSQSKKSNTAKGFGTVEHLLAEKGNAIFSVRRDDPMQKAVDLLGEKRIGALLVLSEAGDLEGILSERDIVRKLSETPGKVLEQKVEVLMTRTVKTCTPDEPLMAVLRTMTDGRFRHMPVMRGAQVIGIVTIGDVVHYRLRELEHETVKLKQMIVG
ncbi:MAG: CBS domain-containing protein [Pseudomonadota bacterium]